MKIEKFLGLFTCLVSVSSVLAWCEIPIGNTFVWWTIQTLILICFYLLWKRNAYKVKLLNLFMLLILCSAVYGVFCKAEIYWDYKELYDNLMIFMLCLASYAYMQPSILTKSLRAYLRFAPLLLLILWPFLASDAFGRFLVPYSFMALFLSELSGKNKLLVGAAFIITLVYGFESRSDILKFSMCVALGLSFYFKAIERRLFAFLKIGRMLFLLIPFVFFGLAVSGVFNVFNIDEELGFDNKYTMGKGDDEFNAMADTRTFLYVEELKSAIKNNYVIQGNSIARGYDSVFFGDGADKEFGIKRGERQSCEVSILNIFNYFGLIGFVIYFLIFSTSSYYAISKSNNRFVPIIGLYVAFRWTFAWIEDFSKFDLNYMFLWIMIGICYSPIYRNMTDEDFKEWIKSFNGKKMNQYGYSKIA